MKNKVKFGIVFFCIIVVAIIVIYFIPSEKTANLENEKCEYNGIHMDMGQAYFEYECEICQKKNSNSGSKSDKLCKDCSKKYNRCVSCGRKVD